MIKYKQGKRKVRNIFKTHDYAFQIKTTTRAMFNCEDFGLGLISDTEFIEDNPFIPMIMVLGNFYNKMDGNSKIKIDDFIERYNWLMGKSIEEIGETKIEEIIREFNKIVATV